MSATPRYLTKSRFKTALECSIKLFYSGKKEYPDSKIEDAFLQSLAQGGFQVGEMAKLYYPGGVDIKEKSNALAERQTIPLLEQDQVTIYEAAIRYQNFFVRTDILVKNGNTVDLIEVKAKSINPSDFSFFVKRGDRLDKDWESYIADAAFQRYVLQLAYPHFTVNSFLMLANKEEQASVDGLNQLFKIVPDGRNTHAVFTGDKSSVRTFRRLLIPIPVDEEVKHFADTYSHPDFGNFASSVQAYAAAYASDTPLYPTQPLGKQCKNCEFHPAEKILAPNAKSGYQECWQKFAGFNPADFDKPHIFDIWNFQGKKFLEKGIYFQEELKESAVITKPLPVDSSTGLSQQERQWLQVRKSTQRDETPYLDKENLKRLLAEWIFPLHFIDFETATVAIPFHKGQHPYEQIAFQFSHHTIDDNGHLQHAGEFIAAEPGDFPNFKFLRALKNELDSDNGTIFRYAPHENTVLNQIAEQLRRSGEPDRDELLAFIERISYHDAGYKKRNTGARNMVDLRTLVIKYYYHPAMKGSNSLKYVLPATLMGSEWLQNRYARPIYGTSEIPSHNYANWQWIRHDSAGLIIDPYTLLPRVVEGVGNDHLDDWLTNGNEKIANGGAALTAYSRLQFEEMLPLERERLRSALLKYCELDTLAMVMLYEAWREWGL